MVDERECAIASLFEEIAEHPTFAQDSYTKLNLILGDRKVSPVIGEAWNEATELYVTWQHIGKKLAKDSALNEETTRKSRDLLRLLAAAIRHGITEYTTIDSLRKRIDEGKDVHL